MYRAKVPRLCREAHLQQIEEHLRAAKVLAAASGVDQETLREMLELIMEESQ